MAATDNSNTTKGSLMTIKSKEAISKMVTSTTTTTNSTIETSRMVLLIKEASKKAIRIGSKTHQSNNTSSSIKIRARNQRSNAINKMNDRNGNEVKTITTIETNSSSSSNSSSIPISMKAMLMIIVVGRIMEMVVGTTAIVVVTMLLATITNRTTTTIQMAKMSSSNTSIKTSREKTTSAMMQQQEIAVVLPFTPPQTMEEEVQILISSSKVTMATTTTMAIIRISTKTIKATITSPNHSSGTSIPLRNSIKISTSTSPPTLLKASQSPISRMLTLLSLSFLKNSSMMTIAINKPQQLAANTTIISSSQAATTIRSQSNRFPKLPRSSPAAMLFCNNQLKATSLSNLLITQAKNNPSSHSFSTAHRVKKRLTHSQFLQSLRHSSRTPNGQEATCHQQVWSKPSLTTPSPPTRASKKWHQRQWRRPYHSSGRCQRHPPPINSTPRVQVRSLRPPKIHSSKLQQWTLWLQPLHLRSKRSPMATRQQWALQTWSDLLQAVSQADPTPSEHAMLALVIPSIVPSFFPKSERGNLRHSRVPRELSLMSKLGLSLWNPNTLKFLCFNGLNDERSHLLFKAQHQCGWWIELWPSFSVHLQ